MNFNNFQFQEKTRIQISTHTTTLLGPADTTIIPRKIDKATAIFKLPIPFQPGLHKQPPATPHSIPPPILSLQLFWASNAIHTCQPIPFRHRRNTGYPNSTARLKTRNSSHRKNIHITKAIPKALAQPPTEATPSKTNPTSPPTPAHSPKKRKKNHPRQHPENKPNVQIHHPFQQKNSKKTSSKIWSYQKKSLTLQRQKQTRCHSSVGRAKD